MSKKLQKQKLNGPECVTGLLKKFPDSIQKLVVVADFLMQTMNSDVSASEFVRVHPSGIADTTLWEWVNLYTNYLSVPIFEGGQGKRKTISNTPEVRRAVSEFHNNVETISLMVDRIANRHKLPVRTDVRIGLYPSLISYLGPALLAALQVEPNIQVQFLPTHDEHVSDQILDGICHLGIGDNYTWRPPGIVDTLLNYEWPYPGVVFRADSVAFANLISILTSKRMRATELLPALRRQPMYLVGSSSFAFAEDRHIAALNNRLASVEGKKELPNRVYLPTYRQCRLVVRQGIGIGIGPPPVNRQANKLRTLWDGAFIGTDEDAPGIELVFIPGAHIAPDVFEPCSTGSYGSFALLENAVQFRPDKNAKVTKKPLNRTDAAIATIKRTILQLCDGALGDFGYLDFQDNLGSTSLRHNFLY
jgi:DNA-binding transcriptional LysR family regulator